MMAVSTTTKKLDPRIERLLLILEARRAGALEQAKGVRIEVDTAPLPTRKMGR